jgi:hypothetical protein
MIRRALSSPRLRRRKELISFGGKKVDEAHQLRAELTLTELKLDRLIDEMRFLKSHTIAFDMRLRGIEAYLKPSEPSEQQPESKSTPWLAAAASATSRTGLFGVGAAVGAAVTKLYLGT